MLYAVELDSSQVQFNRDIRPILSDRCFLCHGPDQSSAESKETDLRLDLRESALELGAIAPGNSGVSELIARISSDDLELRMPLPSPHRPPLSQEEIEIFRHWIDQGAEYEQHWAFIPPMRSSTPVVPIRKGKNSSKVVNPIDAFVLARLAQEKLSPSPEADRSTLIRRVTLDLTGLTPTPTEVQTFLSDPAPLDVAYEKVVDRLLNSEHFGEHMARFWLDAARYADTNGYQYDLERTQWVWRDWVIHAFNTNMPFDRFTVEQIAGDLITGATDQTRLATAFHRNHPITIEGGVIDEEYRTEYVIDRAVTTSTIWLGMTFACARCHDHKYDPLSQEDFYSFFAFFNNVPERGLNGFDPKRKISSPLSGERIAVLNQKIALLENQLEEQGTLHPDWEQQLSDELQDVWSTPNPQQALSIGGEDLQCLADGSFSVQGEIPKTATYEVVFRGSEQVIKTISLEVMTPVILTNGSTGPSSDGNFVLSEIEITASTSGKDNNFNQIRIATAEANYEQDEYPIAAAIDGKSGDNGWAADGQVKHDNCTALFTLAEPIPAGSVVRIRLIQDFGHSRTLSHFRLTVSPFVVPPLHIQETLAIESGNRNLEQQSELIFHLVTRYGDQDAKRHLSELDRLNDELTELQSSFPETMVMVELKEPRTAYVLDRGEYDKPRMNRPLLPNVPKVLGNLPENVPNNRLGLAKWLTSRSQPLTARVTVNRFWQQVFGIGLVKTSEDFGSQGEWPSHPKLLDWLAVEFMDSGWDIKHLMKMILMTSTYRQSSRTTAEMYTRDPENRLLARGPRFRLDGETIRDAVLTASGLINANVGGQSVYPYHPEGLWLEINNRPNASRPYPHPKGRDQLYRRSIYTFWKRALPPPSMFTFDAPTREYCVVRRSRTNTPLQAFVMLHDPQFVEAARHLAERIMREGGDRIESRINYGLELCTARAASTDEIALLRATFNERLEQYRNDPTAARKLMTVGYSARDESLDLAEHAAYTQVSRVLLNLSEFFTKE